MLHFLLFEDDANDSQLIQQVLRESQIEHQVVWVKTRADFLTALSTASIDLILASCHLPGLDSIEALKLTLQTCPEIPFIVLLSSLSEELAIDLLNQGATDYVSKQHLGRLTPTVNRALREVSERRNRHQAQAMLTEQKRLLEQMATGHPLDDCLAAVCSAIAQLSPHTRACFLLTDAHRQTFSRSITPDFPPSLGEAVKDLPINDLCIGTCGEAVYRGEPITCADIAHDHRWSQDWRNACIAHGILACHSKPVMDIDGLPVGSLMLCFREARYPTEWEYQLADFGTQIASVGFERDRALLALHTRETQLQTLFDAAPLGIYLVDQDFRIQQINPIARPVFGNISDLIGRDFDEVVHILWPQAYADEVVEQFRHTLATGEPYIVPELIKERADRKVVDYYEWQLNRIPLPNGRYGAVCYFRDISAQVLARQAHIESESRFRLIVESAQDYAMPFLPSTSAASSPAGMLVPSGCWATQNQRRLAPTFA